jgi:O-phospho-L-seryl-tRNASec:L-selenocysteinyl-tRNA synthase
VGQICKKYNIFHVVNNAYGCQDEKTVNLINSASNKGRVDAVVQSFDKNFMVPVGGAIVFSKDAKVIQDISEMYPGRGSASPNMDLFITFLSMGKKGLMTYLSERKENFTYLKEKLAVVANKYGEKVLELPNNGISIGLSLKCLNGLFDKKDGGKLKDITFVGAMLYQKRVMGSRVVGFKDKEVCGINFKNYGAEIDNYSELPYITAAAAMGITKKEIDVFVERLVGCFEEVKKMHAKSKKEPLVKTISLEKKEEVKEEEKT